MDDNRVNSGKRLWERYKYWPHIKGTVSWDGSSGRPKLMVVNPCFLLKIARTVELTSMYKTGSSAEFPMTQPMIHWHIALWRPRYDNGRTTVARTARAAKTRPKTFGSSRNKKKWQVLAVHATVVRPLAYHGRHIVICQRTLPDMSQSGK
jgi:hypothetical protein